MVDLDLWANCLASEFFPPEGPSVNPEDKWPFPTSLRPQKQGLPKYNPNNEEAAPL